MLLISSHLDRVIQDYDLSYQDGQHVGLLDNFMGVLLTYLVLYDDPNIRKFEREGKIRVWHGKGEEWGRLDDAPKLTKKDLAIVVDVAAGPQYIGKQFGIENVSGLSKADAKALWEDLEWQGFTFVYKPYTGDPMEEDEGWKWRERGVPTLSFIIPIQAKDDGWHRIQQDNTVSAETVAVCRQALKRILTHFIG
jgi:hypothetical protein